MIEEKTVAGYEESFEDIEEKLVQSERAWLDATGWRNTTQFQKMLAPDFTQASAQTGDASVGKNQYLANTLKETTPFSFVFDKLLVRVTITQPW